jgi:hypothetical protein
VDVNTGAMRTVGTPLGTLQTVAVDAGDGVPGSLAVANGTVTWTTTSGMPGSVAIR